MWAEGGKLREGCRVGGGQSVASCWCHCDPSFQHLLTLMSQMLDLLGDTTGPSCISSGLSHCYLADACRG